MPLHRPDWTDPSGKPDSFVPPVQIWRLRLGDLDGDPEDTLLPLTVPSEHRRAQRYEFDADRHRHLAGRALVRLGLSRHYERAPRDFSITEAPHGKPHLPDAPDGTPTLHFNVAHTDDVVVAAFSRTHPVGIDVESLKREADVEALAERIFTDAERQRWRTLPDDHRRDTFFHLWTCKEAFLKATGQGLQRAPHTIECQFDGNMVATLDDADGYTLRSSDSPAARWAVRSFVASEGIFGALVREHDLPSPLVWSDASHFLDPR
jgi:4'-phosphopantetheinyl transferase